MKGGILYLILPILFLGTIVFFQDSRAGGMGQSLFKIVNRENMGFPLNSSGDDFCPSVTGDGLMMVFNSKLPTEKTHNIFYSKYENGRWSRPIYFAELNSREGNDETPFISHDGSVILFSSDRDGTIQSIDRAGERRITYDIYISRKNSEGGWSTPRPVAGDVNTIHNERSPSLSKDKKRLYFTRWPFKNVRRSAIYVARLEDRIYASSTPLPPPVNTGNYEIGFTPSSRENVFFFSSRRPGGYGGWDVFYTIYNDGKFSEAVNLGPEINTRHNEMCLSESNGYFYYCSNRPHGLGEYDLYSAKLLEDSFSKRRTRIIIKDSPRSKKKTRIRFRVYREREVIPLSAKITVYLKDRNTSNEKALRTITRKSDASGRFTVIPKPDVKYITIKLSKAGYAPVEKTIKVIPHETREVYINLTKKTAPLVKDEYLPDAPEEKEIEEYKYGYDSSLFSPIYFSFNSSNIRLQYIPQLHKILKYLRHHKYARLKIIGHSDLRGNAETNHNISYRRALAVKKYLVKLGISSRRIEAKGVGSRSPVVYKTNKHAGELNRRVEFFILKKRP